MSSDRSVALIIAAKDAASSIGRATASALAQVPVTEVVVVDDGSSDGTADAARRADDGSGRLKVIALPANCGPSAARNLAMAESGAALVGILDADDYLKPGRVAAMLAQAPAEWDLLADNMTFLSSESDPQGERLIEPDLTAPRRIGAAEFVRSNLGEHARHRRELGFLKPLMRRAFLERHNLRYDESLRLGEDYVLYAEAMIHGAVLVLVKDCGYVAVEHAHSLSGSHGADELAALANADSRLLEMAVNDADLHREILQHSRITGWKVEYRRMLDAKRQKRFPAMFGHLFRTPTTAAYILGQTCRAWTAPLA